MGQQIIVIKPKPKQDVDEGLPPWMATFADMVTLLLCFFVLLLSFANQDVQKFKQMLGSIQNAFGVTIDRPEDEFIAFNPSEYKRKNINLSHESEVMLGLVLKIKKLLQEDPKMETQTGVAARKAGALVNAQSGAMFDKGSAKLSAGGKKILNKIILILKEHNYDLVVRGHTDDREYKNTSYPSNWELSSARAATALEYIADKGGISPTRMKAVGYANTRPVAKNATPADRARNRRIEFLFHQAGMDYW